MSVTATVLLDVMDLSGVFCGADSGVLQDTFLWNSMGMHTCSVWFSNRFEDAGGGMDGDEVGRSLRIELESASELELAFAGDVLTIIRDHGHAHGSRRSELTNYLGENPGGTLGTAQANPCCWLTPTGP